MKIGKRKKMSFCYCKLGIVQKFVCHRDDQKQLISLLLISWHKVTLPQPIELAVLIPPSPVETNTVDGDGQLVFKALSIDQMVMF